ncbi:MAG TPA: efflux RND transporter periplasmic adaptor subunit [Allosphingosinicella sp.]|nr:efflux RND transporter periplasmic adaptor subunit [Allosphingosinicella sp.]
MAGVGKMKAMNVEKTRWRTETVEGEVLDEVTLVKRRRRKRVIIALSVVAVLLALLAVFAFAGGSEEKAAPPEGKARGAQAPSVTVVVPGRQQVTRVISTTGSLAARVEMPVGIAGEGGMVSRVLVQPGQWVGSGQTLAVIDRSVQAQEAQRLAASIEVARADARLAQQELDRAEALVARGFVSKADVERRTAARDAANARVRVAQAQLGESRARIGRLDIRAPAAGLVLERNVEPGQVVSGGTGALFRIARGGEMEMIAQLPQQELAVMRVGLPVEVTPVGSPVTLQGRVWQISPVIDPQTRQGAARIAVPYHPSVRPGGFAEAKVTSGAQYAPLLPQSAVLSDERGNYVYIVGPGDKIVRRDVRVGTVDERGVTIAAGLSGQERVVLSAGAFLNPDQKVVPVRAVAR